LRAAEKKLEQRRTENRLAYYKPYTKQLEFHNAGATHRERLFMAGNQLGKTVAGAAEAAMHLTGRYPDDWGGRRWDRAIVGWAAGVTGESTRDNVQRLLLGRPGQHGTGFIPKSAIADAPTSRGVPDLVDHIKVQHVSGGQSIVYLKSYEKGREKWQGDTIDFLWFDEEPGLEIYSEGLTRTQATGGMVWMTFTPLLGMSDVVVRFLMEESPDRHVTRMTIDDAEHYTKEERERIIAGYPAHEREARARGVPIMGSGRVFPVVEELIRCEPFPIPEWWPVVGGIDFGWDHPFAAIRLAWDRDADCVYVTHGYRVREATPLIHCAALKPWGDWFPYAWPHDGLQHDKAAGKPLAQYYREQGLKLHFEHAQFAPNADGSPGGTSVEAGISHMLERMQQGRFKVFSTCGEWFEEFRMYHRKEGLIVKERDDLMSATRYAVMMLRIAQGKKKPPNMDKYARRAKRTEDSWLTA
jgi:phage terminase large subunit-like protein